MKRRYTAALLAFALALALLPVSANGTGSGKLEAITPNHDGNKPAPSGNLITVTPGTLEWAEKGAAKGGDGWWAGVNIEFSSLSKDKADAMRYKTGESDSWNEVPWEPTPDESDPQKRVVKLWGEVNPLIIAHSGKDGIEYKWSFRESAEGTPVEYTLRVDPSHLKLKKDSAELYPSPVKANEARTVEPASVKSTDENIKVKAIAPAYVTKDWISYMDEGVSYQESHEYNVWSDVKTVKPDSGILKTQGTGADERYYIEFTVPLEITNGEIDTKDAATAWRVDWDKDYQIAKDTDFKGFEQTYILDLSKTKVTYHVTFDLNDGTSTTPTSKDINNGEKVPKPADPTRDGYTFNGWYTDRDGSTAWNFDTGTVTEDMTLYAKWTQNSTGPVNPSTTYTVTFNMNSAEAAAPEQQTVKANEKVTKPADPTRDGYTFGGWFREAACTTAWNFDTDTVTENTTLYAKWTAASPGGNPGTGDTAKVTLPDAIRYVPWAFDLRDYGDFAGGKDYKLEEKPSWLGIRNGLLSAVPTSAGTYTFTISYTNKSGAAVKETVQLEVLRASSSNLDDLEDENWDYRITDPTEEVYGYNGGCYLTSRGDYDEFEALYLDGDELDEGTDYGAWRGSTVVEIYPRALRRAGYGSHTVALAFQDDNGELHCVAQNFTIRRSGSSSDDDDDDRSPRVTINNRRGGTVRTYSDGEISIKVNSGYTLGEVTVNGKSVSVPSNGRLTGLRARDRVEVTFESDTASTMSPNSINIWAPPGGSAATSTGGTWLGFRDVSPDAYYYNAVQWAVNNSITKGKGNRTFQPNGTCTRADMLTFLWRAAGSPEPTGSGKQFTDVPSGAYYAKAVQWASAKGLVKGSGKRQFQPNALVTRGEAVTFLYRSAGSPAASSAVRFEDVRTGAYYLKPVSWAASNGIADGVSSSHFRPERPCTRAEVMTFLYRRYQ